MELFTRNQDPSWERILHIFVHRCNGIPEFISDAGTYKILVLDSGSLSMEEGGNKKVIFAPSVILLTDEKVTFAPVKEASTTTVFLKPTEIREEFTPERIKAGEFENKNGQTIYQDYLLVKSFEKDHNGMGRVLPLSLSAYTKISKTIGLMNNELTLQHDGYWPCRSRSFMMELLYFISYVCDKSMDKSPDKNSNTQDVQAKYSPMEDTVKSAAVSEIMQYLSANIGEKVTLEDIMKKFSINRNRLNELFVQETSMTCLNYLVKMRVNLAQILLAETELQIAEIADRVGYGDPNYFIKVFKKNTGVTPSRYRESCR